MKFKLLCATAIFAALLSGCASNTRYHWAGYADNVYQHEANQLTDEEYLEKLVSGVQYAEKNNKLVPPGYYADVGTAYLKLGDADSALAYYEKERNLWPESQYFMDTLIKGIKKNLDAFKGNAK